MNLKKVQEAFLDCASIKGSVFLLKPVDAKRFVEVCRGLQVRVVGLEAFRIFGKKIQPDQDRSTDLYDFTGDVWNKTLQDIENLESEGVWFEVVVLESDLEQK